MVRKVTAEKFELWVANEENVLAVLDLISGGKTLQKAALEVKQPYTCLHEYFHRTPENLARYEGARKAWADAVMDEAMRIADGVAPDRDAVAKAKLRVEVRQNQAKAYHRDRWGDRVHVEKSITVSADAALLGRASDLLRIATEKVVGGVELAGDREALPELAARPPAE